MDVLTDVLDTVRLRSCFCSRSEIQAPWAVAFEQSPDAMFHVMNFGAGWLSVDGLPGPVAIGNGDVVLLPHGHAHTICDRLDSPVLKTTRMTYADHQGYQVLTFGDEQPCSLLLCGVYHVERPAAHPLLALMPPLIHIPGDQQRSADSIGATLELMSRESQMGRPGAETMLRRLADMLFIQVVRIWIEQQPAGSPNWLAALRDPQVGRALNLIHSAPERPWRVTDLAAATALSRSAFAARFSALVGEPPARYLSRWRMRVAADLLRGGIEVGAVARRLGYESDAAFRKAFKREFDVPPGGFRRSTRRVRLHDDPAFEARPSRQVGRSEPAG